MGLMLNIVAIRKVYNYNVHEQAFLIAHYGIL